MPVDFRLNKNDLFDTLESWNKKLSGAVFLVACGGTALTLYGYKESTRDVDFLVPDPVHYDRIIRLVKDLGYTDATGAGFRHPNNLWIFEFFRGQRIFQTDILDPIQEPGKHRVIRDFGHITLACINPDDLIISKMFRGTSVDVQDSVVMIKSETINLGALAERYKETAGYYYNPNTCKTNLAYLIADLEQSGIDATPLKEMNKSWIP